MYVDEPPKDGNIPDFNISKIDICPFRAYQRSFRLFQGNFSKDIHLRSRLLCFTQNDHTGQTEFKICPFLKWAQRGILKVKDYLFTFLSNPSVPYENNASERGVRKIKIKQKVSGCFRTDSGADDFAKLHSIAETAMKNGNSKFNAILAVVQQ